MFVCRTGRLSAAALDRARRSPASFLLQANKQRRFAFTLRKGHACLCASVGGVDSTPAHPIQKWDSPTGLAVTEWGHLHRVATIAKHLSKSAQTGGAHVDGIRRPLVRSSSSSSRGEPPGAAVFTGRSTRTMHSSASSSTASATKRSEEHTADGNKEDEQNIKKSSATCSSTEKLPGEPEPEGGKPNKTQQLKNVFKEYGAVGVSFHIGISLMSLGMFYLLISSGIDMAAALCKLGFSEAVVRSKMAAGTSTFVLAYAIHKLFAPVRISITLVSVPLIVRYFRKTGLFKPPTPAP